MGHSQKSTPIFTDNSTAAGIDNDSLKQNRSKSMDMRYHWICYRIKQRQFIVHWEPHVVNKAGYFTKHHSPAHHTLMKHQ